MMMNVEQSVEWELAGETEVRGGNLTKWHFVHHKPHMAWSGLEPGPPSDVHIGNSETKWLCQSSGC
jgi:hypothetical protein